MSFQTKLLHWFHKNARPLPWRKHYRPYEVWISEIMLQQTQMETVLPYFERWMKTFPTVESLADSPEEKVLKHWQGLGYYSRARNLHESAKRIVSEHGGNFPSDFEIIKKLKGVGPYTAGAIASIAFNEERPIVDGNILRVLARVYAINKPINDLKYRDFFWKTQSKLIPKGHARFFNQALMELGALVCTTQNPKCVICPLNQHCLAYQKNRVEDYPVRLGRKKLMKVHAAALILENRGHYFLHKRPLGKIMGGLWEFPEWKLAQDKKISLTKTKEMTSEQIQAEFKLSPASLQYLSRIKRNYTHHLETLFIFKLKIKKRPASSRNWPHAWVHPKNFPSYPFSSAHAKIAAVITDDERASP